MDLDRNALGGTPKAVSNEVKRFCGLATPDDGLTQVKFADYYDECK
jgi:hypothetical protein